MKHLLALLFVIPATLFAANHPKLDTVPYVNVQKYLGTYTNQNSVDGVRINAGANLIKGNIAIYGLRSS